MAPGVSLDPRSTNDDSPLLEYSGRPVYTVGREKYLPDPAWNKRLIEIAGRDLYGDPIFRVEWGWNATRIGSIPRFPHVVFQWLLLRKFPASTFGTWREWYEPRIEEGQWTHSLADEFREEWPATGAYEIDYAFRKGVPFNWPYIEDRARRFVARPKLPPLAQRQLDARREVEAKEQEQWQRDYEHFCNVARPFNAQPFVGYGKKRAPPKAKPEPMTPQMNEVFQRVHAGRMERFRRQGKRVVNV